MKLFSIKTKILLGRLLTKSGDQAWDFAVPLVILSIYPDQLRLAAGYFLIVKFLHVLLMPRFSVVIDQRNRLHVAYLGTIIQLIGVIVGAACVLGLKSEITFSIYNLVVAFLLCLSGLLSSMGSSLMSISVGNDLVPAAISSSEMTAFNSRMRQLDLFAEVTSPVLAGVLLALQSPAVPLFGFLIIAAWNIVSFVPETMILKSIFKNSPELLKIQTHVAEISKLSLLSKLKIGWTSFFRQPIAPSMIAYALLWLSVLSPHGVLLTGYLKAAWKMPEAEVGFFRGMGAVFGLLATAIFPIIVAKFGLIRGSRHLLTFQAITLIFAFVFYNIPTSYGQYGFLILILCSRIGLYGFSLGEMQIRQVGIAAHERGEVNGFADALTGIATLTLFIFGVLLPTTSQFSILVIGSVIFVALGCLIFWKWSNKNEASI